MRVQAWNNVRFVRRWIHQARMVSLSEANDSENCPCGNISVTISRFICTSQQTWTLSERTYLVCYRISAISDFRISPAWFRLYRCFWKFWNRRVWIWEDVSWNHKFITHVEWAISVTVVQGVYSSSWTGQCKSSKLWSPIVLPLSK